MKPNANNCKQLMHANKVQADEIIQLREELIRYRREWQRECEQTDLLLQGLGLCPSEYRSDGGSLLLGRIKHKVGNIMLDNERLRELLREALPAVASYIRKNERAQQAAERRDDVNMVDKHASMVRHYSRIKSDIDAALPSDQPAHHWREAHGPIKWPHCQVCGVIQRSDEQNGSCKGPVAITTRTDQPSAVAYGSDSGCARCNDTGLVFDERTITQRRPCPDCADLRRLLGKSYE